MTQSNTPSRTSANDEAHWRKTTNLMLIHLGIWVFFGYIVHMFVKPLNKIIIPIPDFPLGFYGGNFARFLGVIVLVCFSFTYVTAQVYGTGLIASRFLGMQFEIAVFAGLVGILLCSMLGGMRAVTWTQIAQYIVLIVAYLTPIVILSTQHFGIPIPELTYGKAIADITAREQQLVRDGLAVL
jgi:cation/acetate symporter